MLLKFKSQRIYSSWLVGRRAIFAASSRPSTINTVTESKFSQSSILASKRSSKFDCYNLLNPSTSLIRTTNNGILTSYRHFRVSNNLFNEIKEVVVPQLAESLTEGDIRWVKAVGDAVAQDEVVGEVETDKTAVPIHSPVAGVIEELLVEDGATVNPGQVVLRIRVGGESTGEAPKPETSAAPKAEAPPGAAETPSQPSSPPPPPAPPAASTETSPKPVSQTPVSAVKSTAESLGSSSSAEAFVGARKETRVKMNRMRLRIAQRLKDAQNTYAMLTTFNEIDMRYLLQSRRDSKLIAIFKQPSNIIQMRNNHKDTFQKKHNLKLGFMSAFIKATAFALMDQPIVNAVIEGNEIVYRDYIDISVAVATPKGLVVPVIRNVEHMNYAQIEKAISELGEKARNNALAIEDMDGGTFTISNGGVFGSMFGTPIINPPQSAILGMHAIIDRPVVIDKKIEIRPMMYVCVTYDHRLIDGREAVTFLRKIKAAVEDPRVMLLDV